MILGMSLAAYTFTHVLISLVGLASGFVVLTGLITRRERRFWTPVFLSTTVATSVTGFGFPFDHLLPSHIVGILSLIVLAIAIASRYAFHSSQPWGRIYAACACIALYFNVFVAVVQAFQKIPALKSLAPTQSEAPFVFAQVAVLACFIALSTVAIRKSAMLPSLSETV